MCILVASSVAHAQNTQAEALFRDGTQLMAEGKLAQACDAFEASNRLEPRAGTLISLGQCREQNRQLASAWSAYKRALARVKDPRKREFATARVADLESRLSSLTVSVPAEARAAGLVITRGGAPVEPALWNRPVPVDGGDYVIAARAPDHEGWQTTVHVAASNARLTVAVPRLKEARQTSAAAPPPSPSPPSSPTSSSSPASSSSPSGPPASAEPPASSVEGAGRPGTGAQGMLTTRRKIAIGVAGASVVSAIVGVALGVSASGLEDDAFKLCPDPATPCGQARRSNELIQSSHSRADQANVVLGVAAFTAITAGFLWLTGAPDPEASSRVSVVPGVAPGAASVLVTGRF
ncbi:MAG TPA: hypothetical protein VFK02_33170 [Kofleriaceae bacterium]|nr:hypothetical protein [Kofleriaceae bacterium]